MSGSGLDWFGGSVARIRCGGCLCGDPCSPLRRCCALHRNHRTFSIVARTEATTMISRHGVDAIGWTGKLAELPEIIASDAQRCGPGWPLVDCRVGVAISQDLFAPPRQAARKKATLRTTCSSISVSSTLRSTSNVRGAASARRRGRERDELSSAGAPGQKPATSEARLVALTRSTAESRGLR